MKQIVTKANRYEPIFSEALKQWALHYNITLLATRVAKPKDKGAVENEVKIAYQRIYAPLRDEVFYQLDQLNLAVIKQLDMHNEKLFQLKDFSRLQQFINEEQSLLQPLPAEPFVIRHQILAKVQKNYHVTLGEDYHHYSVPYQFIGKQVSAVYDTDTVEIYYQHKRISLHKRSYKKHNFTTIGDHMPQGHQHFFEQKENYVEVTDLLEYETPFGIFGQLFDKLFLKKHLTNFIIHRNAVLKNLAEQQ